MTTRIFTGKLRKKHGEHHDYLAEDRNCEVKVPVYKKKKTKQNKEKKGKRKRKLSFVVWVLSLTACGLKLLCRIPVKNLNK